MILVGNSLAFLSALILILLALVKSLSVLTVVLLIAIFTLAAGVIAPNGNAGAMQALRHKAGASAAIIGFTLYLSSSLFSTVITAVSIQTLWPLAIYILVAALLSFVPFYVLILRKPSHVTTE